MDNRNTFYYTHRRFALVDEMCSAWRPKRSLTRDIKVTNWYGRFYAGYVLCPGKPPCHISSLQFHQPGQTGNAFYDVTISGMTAFVSSQAEGLMWTSGI